MLFVSRDQVDEDEMKALRDKILDSRRAVHKRTEEEVSKRWSYEEGVSTHLRVDLF